MERTVFVCQDSLDGILTGVYDAWASRLGHGNVRLMVDGQYTLELFCQYRHVETRLKAASSVMRTVEHRLGEEAAVHICQAAACVDDRKADAIYRMIVLGLSLERGSEIVNCLTYDPVATVMELSQTAWREYHRWLGFVRFRELQNGVLYAAFHPKHQVLSMVAPHFADRLKYENWMIHDVNRNQIALHQKGKGWFLVEAEHLDLEKLQKVSDKEYFYEELWRCFHDSISIEARRNEALQRQMLPLRFRPHMTEFAE